MARKPHQYLVGEVVNNLMILEKANKITIEGWQYNSYIVKCPVDDYTFEILESELMRGRGCPVCSNNIVVKGINDINTTANWMCSFIKNKEDCYTFSKNSGKRILFKCPDCGFEKMCVIGNVSNRGFNCNACSDKISMGEKIMTNLLTQAGVKFKTQLNKSDFKWCDKYKYDFYILNKSTIIETHGLQHYDLATGKFYNKNKNQKEIDSIKYQLANKNGIKQYIVIDCRNSEFEYIKNSIISSGLLDLIDCEIDWELCFKNSLKSYIVTSCEMYSLGKNKEYISKKLNKSIKTINDYLKKGNELGLCEYNTDYLIKMAKENGVKKMSKATSKEVVVYKNNAEIATYQSCNDLCRKSILDFGVQFHQQAVSKVCNGHFKQHKGYEFKFKKEVSL